VKEMLGQSTFNYPKLYLLTHYAHQIECFGSLPQYSTEITEALHKPLKDAYRQSNRVDTTPQILDRYIRESACRMLELNLYAWGKELELALDIKNLVSELQKERQGPKGKQEGPMFGGRQQPRSTVPEPLSVLARRLRIPILVTKFEEYMRLNGDLGVNRQNAQDMARYQGEYFNSVGIPVPQFQGDGMETHHVR